LPNLERKKRQKFYFNQDNVPIEGIHLPQIGLDPFQRTSTGTVSSSVDVETDATPGDGGIDDIDLDLALHNKYS